MMLFHFDKFIIQLKKKKKNLEDNATQVNSYAATSNMGLVWELLWCALAHYSYHSPSLEEAICPKGAS